MHLELSFFHRRVQVVCDTAAVADALALIYERHLAHDEGEGRPHLQVLVESGGIDGPRVVVGARSVRVPSAEQLLHYAHLVLVNAAAASATGVRVLHGGAVERDGRAVVIVAPSGAGKTTTTLALVRRGWRLLSDDFAVLAPDGVVQPFLRRLNLADDTWRLLGLVRPPTTVYVATSRRSGKWMTDPADLYPASVGGPSKLRALIVMEPRESSAAERAARAARRSCQPALPPVSMESNGEARVSAAHRRQGDAAGRCASWELLVDHTPVGLVDRVSAIPGVRDVCLRPMVDGALLRLDVHDGARIVPRLDEALASLDVAALAVSRRVPAVPAPGPRPCVARLSREKAVTAALAHDLGLSGKRFLGGMHAGEVSAAWHRLAQAASCVGDSRFRLWPGDLEPTVDLIERCALDGQARAPDV